MRILAIETSTRVGGAALLDGDHLIAEYTLRVPTTHSEQLMVTVDRLLTESGWKIGELQGVAVSIGPGSFTGLRIGVSTAKGLALALGLAVIGVPTLDALAAALPHAADPVCPILDAKKGEVYTSLFHWEDAGMVRDWEYLALPPQDLCSRLSGPVIFIGDGIAAFGDVLVRALGPRARLAPPSRRLPSAACVGELGHSRLIRGESDDAARLTPLYIRPSEAELRRRRALLFH